MPDPPETIIFLHIPKAAGTSFKRILDRNFQKEEIYFLHSEADEEAGENELKSLPDDVKQRYHLIYGHQYFGLHHYLPGTVSYISILRDPFERAISHYHFVRRVQHNRLHDDALKVTLEDYVLQEVAGKELDNGQTRRLAGVRDNVDCDQAMLEMAISNIENHFKAIGVAERFDETLFLMKKALGLSSIYYNHANRTQRPKNEPIPASTIDLIKEKNRFDLLLYDYVQKRLDTQWGQHPASFRRSMQVFRVMNRFYRLPFETIQFTKRRLGK